MKKILLFFSFIFITSIIVSSCSYKDFEDRIRSKINDNRKGISGGGEKNNDSLNSGDNYDSDKGERNLTNIRIEGVSEKNVSNIGDTIKSINPEFKTYIEYTVNNVELYDSFDEAGITKNNCHPLFGPWEDILNENNNFKDGLKLLIAEVKITNINEELEKDLANIGYINISYLAEYPESVIIPPTLSYFSLPYSKESGNGKDYNMYKLAKGNEVIVKAGWFVDLNAVKPENILIKIYSEENQYVRLNL